MEKRAKIQIINVHTHIFTIDHVPKRFGKKLLPWCLSFITTHQAKWISEKAFKIEKRNPQKIAKFIAKVFNIFKLSKRANTEQEEIIERYLNLAKFANPTLNANETNGQEIVFRTLQRYYPYQTQFVVLSMDMEYMAAGKPQKSFENQLTELEEIKKDDKYKDLIHPFIFVDPRRIQDTTSDHSFRGKFFQEKVKKDLKNKIYSGIKLYPALSYYPFDSDLLESYQYAQEHNIPVLSHCTAGPVHYRGKKNRLETTPGFWI